MDDASGSQCKSGNQGAETKFRSSQKVLHFITPKIASHLCIEIVKSQSNIILEASCRWAEIVRKSHPGCKIGLVLDQDTQLEQPRAVDFLHR